MDLNFDKYNIKYDGFYRAEVIDKTDVKNGVYKVRIYPFFADVEEDKLPFALSNLTNKKKHIILEKGDWVWVFFENGYLNYPIIMDFCNVKGKFPVGSDGEKPDYYDDIKNNDKISEDVVSYNGEYNEIECFNFSEINVEIDRKNKQIVLFVDKDFYIIIDKDKNLHIKCKKGFISSSDFFGLNTGDIVLKMDKNSKLVTLKNNITSIYELYNKIVDIYNDIDNEFTRLNNCPVSTPAGNGSLIFTHIPIIGKITELEEKNNNLFSSN